MTRRAKPNVLLFMADDTSRDWLSAYGGDADTPHIDALAASGVKLQSYYSQHLCTPARASLLTGKYPVALGLHHDEVIGPASPFGLPLSERLRRADVGTRAGH